MFQVYTNGTLIGIFCQRPPTPAKIVSLLGFDIYFHSDYSLNDVGFVLTYSITDGNYFYIEKNRWYVT